MLAIALGGEDGHFTAVTDFRSYPGVLEAIATLQRADILPMSLYVPSGDRQLFMPEAKDGLG
ncbi:MAG: hypothetical protein LKJ06_11800 [Schleiferilactobacillus harbinensis]|jgi:hypothetical protein|nr:hypothetical protein [Schleiferilactobacillus harbinensis]